MRTFYFLPALFAICCSPSSSPEGNKTADTLAAPLELTVAETPETADEPAEADGLSEFTETEETAATLSGDTVWMMEFARDPLGHNTYQGIMDYLQENKIDVKDNDNEGSHTLTFGNSSIDVLVTEAYGDLVCSAVIDSAYFPLTHGVSIGMPKGEFLELAGFSPDYFSANPDKRTDLLEFEKSFEDGDYERLEFWFDETALIRFEYSVGPCIIYD